MQETQPQQQLLQQDLAKILAAEQPEWAASW
jgi:hypothetical protein